MKNYLPTPIECLNFEDFIEKVSGLSDDSLWVFRGEKDAKWTLKTSFERACNRFHIPSSARKRVELNMIREFRRRLHQYTSNVPRSELNDEWLALMQHYGAPTRLLDFTYSPYVASYFAFEKAESNTSVAIWAINCTWCENQFSKLNQPLYDNYCKYRDCREEPGFFNNVFIPGYSPDSIKLLKPHRLVLGVNPFRLNERLAYQKGVFLCPGDISVGFMTNLSIYERDSEIKNNVIKYTIDTGRNNENTIKALQILESMNINSITLFPDLFGFAQSFAPRIHSLFLNQRGN